MGQQEGDMCIYLSSSKGLYGDNEYSVSHLVWLCRVGTLRRRQRVSELPSKPWGSTHQSPLGLPVWKQRLEGSTARGQEEKEEHFSAG